MAISVNSQRLENEQLWYNNRPTSNYMSYNIPSIVFAVLLQLVSNIRRLAEAKASCQGRKGKNLLPIFQLVGNFSFCQQRCFHRYKNMG